MKPSKNMNGIHLLFALAATLYVAAIARHYQKRKNNGK